MAKPDTGKEPFFWWKDDSQVPPQAQAQAQAALSEPTGMIKKAQAPIAEKYANISDLMGSLMGGEKKHEKFCGGVSGSCGQY